MTEQEKRQLVEAVITQLKNEGTDVSSASVVEDVNGVSYVLCYDTNGNIVRVSPDTINQQESTNKDAIEANATAIANEIQRATEAEESLRTEANTNAANLAETKKDIANQLFADSTADKVTLTGRNQQSMRINFSAKIPAATTEKAGVMSAEDKKKVNASIKNIDVNPNVDDVELDLEDNTEKTSHVVFPAATAEKAGVMSAEDKVALDTATSRALRALFVSAGAGYNDTGADKTKTAPWGETVTHKAGHYYLNGLGDITERQMMDIYNAPHDGRSAFSYARNTARTYILRGGTQQASITSPVAWFAQSYLMEVLAPVDFIGSISGSCERMFSGCTNLRHLYLDGFSFLYATSFYSAFTGCSSLITCCIKKVAKNISFTDSSKISKESIIYIIENAAPSSAITITLHPDAYARLAEDADIVAALEAQPFISLVSA